MSPKDKPSVDELNAGILLDEQGKSPRDAPEDGEDFDDVLSDFLTEAILGRLFSWRLNPLNARLKDKEKVAWLTGLPLVEHKSRAYHPTVNRFAVVRSNDQKSFKITPKSIVARDIDVTATTAFDMAMAASLNPKMQKKGVTITAAKPEAAFLLWFAAQEMGLNVTNTQHLMQMRQMHAEAYAAAKQQWDEASPCLKKAFNDKAQQKQKPDQEQKQEQKKQEQKDANKEQEASASGGNENSKSNDKANPSPDNEKKYGPEDEAYEFQPKGSTGFPAKTTNSKDIVRQNFSSSAAANSVDGEFVDVEPPASPPATEQRGLPDQGNNPPALPPPA